MRRKLYLLTFLLILTVPACAQETAALTVYKEFLPATIYLADGRKLKVSLANVFLKNSSLLYKSGIETKMANMNTLNSVQFPDRTYFKVDTLLAYQVDTIGQQALLCAQVIDFESWQQNMVNNSVYSSMDINDMFSYTKADIADEQDLRFLTVNKYFFRLDGKYVLADERHLKRVLNKEKRRLMQSAMMDPSFSWTDEKSLLRMLKIIGG